MGVDANKWLHVPEGVPCIYDVDLNSVDEMGAWVRVKRRVLLSSRSTAELESAMMLHPSGRMYGGAAGVGKQTHAINVCFLKDPKYLPQWIRERIAVLNIAEGDAYIPQVGKRWTEFILSVTVHSTTWSRPGDDGKRWYTLDVNCEKVKP